MRSFIIFFAGLLLLIAVGLGLFSRQTTSSEAEATPTVVPVKGVLFDDFNYTANDDPTLSDHGWIVRTKDGWPGVPNAIWRASDVSFVADPDSADNSLMQMTSSVEGSKTYQTQVCQQRKFYEGTYATRVRFADKPATGADGDNIVETFYMISPQKYDMDPDYSELDFEYLPNGGWGNPAHFMATTTWETFQLQPWIADNVSESKNDSYSGWHTLVVQIADGSASYFIDGKPFATHGGKYYPEVPMSINYNLWFIDGGQITSTSDTARSYVEQVDWAYFATNTVLSPDDIDAQVADLRAQKTTFTDSVPDWTPPLESPCNF